MTTTLWRILHNGSAVEDALYGSPAAARTEAENMHRVSYAERPMSAAYHWETLRWAGGHVLLVETEGALGVGSILEETGFSLAPVRET